MAYTFFKKNFFFKRTDKLTDKRKNGRTDRRTDGRSDFIMPQILFGGIKICTLSGTREYALFMCSSVHLCLGMRL